MELPFRKKNSKQTKLFKKILIHYRFYVFFHKKFFKKRKKIITEKTFPYEIDRINFIDIDDKFTFELAKKVENLKTRN